MRYSASSRIITAFLIGLLIAVLLPMRWAGFWLLVLPLLPLIVLRPPLSWVGVSIAGLLFGLIWQGWALSLRPAVERSQAIIITGEVVSLPTETPNRQRFILAPTTLDNVNWPVPRRIRLSLYGQTPRVAAGERWQLAVRLRRPRGYFNPVRFDYERWLASEHIDATGYVVDHSSAIRLRQSQGVHDWRERVAGKIATLTPSLDQGRAILQGLVSGDRRGFSDPTWAILRATGTSHLVAISGLHIGLIAALGYWLGKISARALPQRAGQRFCAISAGLLAALGYAALSGFALPAQRALIMLSVVAIARLMGWHAPLSRVLLVAALIILMLDPAAALSAGFWLSFGAVALIIGMSRGRHGRGVQMLWRLQLTLVLGLAPLSALFFGQWSPLGLVVNLLAVPLFSLVVVPGALLASALAWLLPAAAGIALTGLGFAIERLLDGGQWLLDSGMGSVAITTTDPLTLLLAALGVGWWILPAGTPLRGLSPVLMLPLLAGSPASLPHASARITWLEVGQGNSVVIETRTQVQVVDTGPSWRSGGSAAAFTLVPFLRNHGIKAVDRLTITHGDNDHRGGLPALAEALAIGRIDRGEPLDDAPRSQPCHRGQHWSVDGVDFAYLWPPRGHTFQGNNASCVLLISTAGARVLLTGDIEHEVERQIAARLERPVDVLEAAHHGSATSTSAALLTAAQPQRVIVSAGYRNPYGMPHAAVLRRVRCHGAVVNDLGRVGAVTLRLDAHGIQSPRAARRDTRRLLNESPQQGRFQNGEEIHYHQRFVRNAPTEAKQITCGN
jgi:competence protein ComEC